MSNKLLESKRGIISGALNENSLAWQTALKAHEQGAQIVLTNSHHAIDKGIIQKLAKQIKSEIIPADANNMDELTTLFTKSQQIMGGKIDFLLHSIGMSTNIRKEIPYTQLDYTDYHKTLDVSALSLHRMLSVAYKMDAMNEWGSVVALSYIAAQRTFSFYTDMAEAKAALESIVRSYGYHYGKYRKVRINSVSQSPTKTTAGGGIEDFAGLYEFAQLNSPLGNASAEACADYCVSLFSDYTKMVTMQNLYHDGGFSCTGASEDLMKAFAKDYVLTDNKSH
jgi:enoyl-[acyl-carrier protein] reductase I